MKEKVKLISLREASQNCEYSQEYLSLRARQGKLKAVKKNKKWMTTKEWLSEYIGKAEDYKRKMEEKKEQNYLSIYRMIYGFQNQSYLFNIWNMEKFEQ